MERGDGQVRSGEVIDSLEWLSRRIEASIEAGETGAAVDYINRLLAAARKTETKLWGYRTLGMLAFRHGRMDRARHAFERAAELEPGDPGMAYALGHCAAAEGRWWRALLDWLEAIRAAKDRDDEAEFMRSAGVAVYQLGFADTALSMLLGAMDRAPDNPWVLETIGHVYEHERMWMEALGMREALIDVLADGLAPRMPSEGAGGSERFENPQFYRLFQAFAIKFDIDRKAIEERRDRITERLRGEIGVVQRERPDVHGERADLTPMNLPRGLYELVGELVAHDRNFRLLESAQSLWARARHDRFDLHLTPLKLSAALQWVLERLHWRVPTPLSRLVAVYRVEPDALQAAARLVVGRFGVRFLEIEWSDTSLALGEWRRLEVTQRALLYGGEPDSVSRRLSP